MQKGAPAALSSAAIRKMTVKELKAQLKKRGQKVSGKKVRPCACE